jgi:adenylate cyclase
MAYEIERKFLVCNESWRSAARAPMVIRQAYLARKGRSSIRVRIIDNDAAMTTVKSQGTACRRLEFEYTIPVEDAAALLNLREGAIIEKLRHELPQRRLTSEIDVFQGENEGLAIADIELPREEQRCERPSWLGAGITSGPKYSNASLARPPFRTWPAWRWGVQLAGEALCRGFNPPLISWDDRKGTRACKHPHSCLRRPMGYRW